MTTTSNASKLLHDLRNGLGRLSACAKVLELRTDDLTPDQATGLEKMQTIIMEMAALTGDLEGELRTGSRLAVDAAGRTSHEAPSTRREIPFERDEPRPPISATLQSMCDPTAPSAATRVTQAEASARGSYPPGTMVAGSYRIQRLLGRGGMGSVFLARDDKLHRDVALKLVDHEAWGGRDAREVFLGEARAMAKVKHPNVVTIHAFGDHAGVPYFVMEYMPGTSLEGFLEARGDELGVDHAIHIVDQVCRGVEAIHRAGALHLDIKPGNVLLGVSFRVAVADLGLARAVGESSGALTGGTPGYIAPELVEDPAARPDERADVYAVGALAYRLLTGSAPFVGDSVSDTLQRQLDGEVVPASQTGHLPEVFDAILARALHRDPRRRHPSAEALRRELGAACDGLERDYTHATVFVVDDDELLRRKTTTLVSKALPGASVYPFADGRDALQGADQLGLPEIAVIDLEMPAVNGVELTAALKSRRDGALVDVVMLSGVASARDWDLLQRLGASGFLFKPVDEAELSAIMRRLASRERRP